MSEPAGESLIAERYRVERAIGAGGMAEVLLARDSVLGRRVAVKLIARRLADDEHFIRRFHNEARAIAQLQHPNVVQIYDFGVDRRSRRCFLVMEYVDGRSLAELLADRGQIGVEHALRIVRGACAALAHAHRAGVVHRDVKPANLMVAGDGKVKLTDFGIAKDPAQIGLTQVGSILGTASYTAPEQARGEPATGASDVYSLGVCAYQMLTGRMPFELNSFADLARIDRLPEPPPVSAFAPEVTAGVDLAVRTAFRRDPRRRFTRAEAFAVALDQPADAANAQPAGDATEPAAGAGADATVTRVTTPVADATATRVIPPVAGATVRQTAARRGPRRVKRRVAIVLIALAAAIAVFGGPARPGGLSYDSNPVRERTIESQVDHLRRLIDENRR